MSPIEGVLVIGLTVAAVAGWIVAAYYCDLARELQGALWSCELALRARERRWEQGLYYPADFAAAERAKTVFPA